VPSVVAERASNLLERAREGGVADRDAAPHRAEDLALRDDALALVDQEREQPERRRIEAKGRPVATKLEERLVDLELAEREDRGAGRHRDPILPPGALVDGRFTPRSRDEVVTQAGFEPATPSFGGRVRF